MEILPSALERGYSVDDLLHAVARSIRAFDQPDGMAMYIGPNQAGNLMEVGVIVLWDGSLAIAHARRPPRRKHTLSKPARSRR